jgi:hypothetical protein
VVLLLFLSHLNSLLICAFLENPKLEETIAQTKFLIERAEAEASGENEDLTTVSSLLWLHLCRLL